MKGDQQVRDAPPPQVCQDYLEARRWHALADTFFVACADHSSFSPLLLVFLFDPEDFVMLYNGSGDHLTEPWSDASPWLAI